MPTVFPSSHMTRENSIMNSACSHVRSTTKPYTVMPARLFSRYRLPSACLCWKQWLFWKGMYLDLGWPESSSSLEEEEEEESDEDSPEAIQ
ncbi:Os02g0566450 [Oryza sativa Japonica Group]|uniref:Os02g0566450 protein n=1 Tax=Oryza sativa subsp. japonica TaxID=39947 RepID=A0A0P0VKL5_ORYSJ|nr:hypothetical protein EE612_011860 [Oryza sativa]BAS79310.1 Os02g0566450 [Oryza sativa Japonica Group]